MGKMYLLNDNILDNLKKSITIEKYQSNSFLENEYSGKQYMSSIDTFININDLPNLYVKEKNEEPLWMQDFNNAIKLHSVINSKNVPIRYLVDERFWTYLTHTVYWDYLQKRWPADSESRIKQKWFFEGGNQVFSRHSLVRLWWLAECSYSDNYPDPYELTKTAFEFQDPFNQVIERKISKSRKIFRAALKALHDTQDAYKLKGDKNRTKFGKAINTIAGVKLIEVMSEDEIVSMFKQQIEYIINE